MSEAEDADVGRLTLLPCPFCGEPPREHYGENSKEHWVACDSESCDVCPTTSGGSIESARRAWNRRQSLSQEAVRDEALEEALRRSPCERLMLQGEFAHVASNCEPCTCWRSALKREPNAAEEPRVTWFVENDDSQWWMGGASSFATDEAHWTSDPHKAKAYKSKKSAQETCDYLFPDADCKATEHIFLPDEPAPAAPVAEMVRRLRSVTANNQLCREAAVLIENLARSLR